MFEIETLPISDSLIHPHPLNAFFCCGCIKCTLLATSIVCVCVGGKAGPCWTFSPCGGGLFLALMGGCFRFIFGLWRFFWGVALQPLSTPQTAARDLRTLRCLSLNHGGGKQTLADTHTHTSVHVFFFFYLIKQLKLSVCSCKSHPQKPGAVSVKLLRACEYF